MLEACHLYCDHGCEDMLDNQRRVSPIVEVWESNPQDFTEQAQSRKVVQLEKIKIVIIHLK
jgi:hypothetical protein